MGLGGKLVLGLLERLIVFLGLFIKGPGLRRILGRGQGLLDVGLGQLKAHAAAFGSIHVVGIDGQPFLARLAHFGQDFLLIAVALQGLEAEIAGQALGRLGVVARLGNHLIENLAG